MVMIIGADAKAIAVGDQQCNIEGAAGEYEVEITRSEAAREMEDWKTLAMPKPITALQGIGDEAYAGRTGNPVIARNGSVAIYISSHVSTETPMPYKEGVVELAKRIVAKLK